jgi:mannose-6-phosphate isomerase-like protein (cupin superfamily)
VPTLPRRSRGFSLAPNAVSKAVVHRTIEEVWYFTSGHGHMWRRLGECEEVVEVDPGISISIPTGTYFQFRCDSIEPLVAIGAMASGARNASL